MSDTLFDESEPQEQRDIFFDPESNPSSRKGKDACKRLMELFLATEAIHTPRTRQRKSKDQQILEQQLGAILGNLVAGTIRKKPTPVAVTQSNTILGCKDSHPVLNDKLPDVLAILVAADVLHKKTGSHSEKKQSTIELAPTGKTLIREFGLKRSDFRHKERKPIVLRARKTSEDKKGNGPGKEIELPDTEDVKRMTEEVTRFNDFLAEQDIQYHGNRPDIDDERKTTHRVFNNGRMNEGGRLYGGFWQSLSGAKEGKPDERADDICINDEHLVGLDYGQIAVRMLYSFEGKQLEMEDAYVLDGWGPECREGMKKLINSMINDSTGEPKALKKLFGRSYGMKVPELTEKAKQSIYQQHAAIRNHFNGTSTYRLFYEESNHLMRVLMKLVDMNIPALPVHDCLYVRLSDENTVRQLMMDMFTDHFKVAITVKATND